MKISQILLISLVLMTAFSLQTCKHEHCFDPTDPDCENYDPCHAYQRPSAKFEMLMNLWYTDKDGRSADTVFSDSIFAGNYGHSIIFNAIDDHLGMQHTWYVGQENFDGPQTPGRDFSSVTIRPARIPITHVIRYEPDSICDPQDDGYDSTVQFIQLVKEYNDLDVLSVFRGAFEGSTDSFDLRFWAPRAKFDTTGSAPLPGNIGGFNSSNFHNWGRYTWDGTSGYEPGRRGIWVKHFAVMNSRMIFSGRYQYVEPSDPGYNIPFGFMEILPNDRFEMRYLFDEGYHIVRGRKIADQ
ncbi:MAG TPA: hypothetical protein DDX92_10995 [Flavobacteriales bacterium]|jgi:hypothetical protein|nr:hypothetical protein [Flavobacteriales bacterium]